MTRSPYQLRVVSATALQQFRELALSRRLNPDDIWVGGYVAYEWEHIRHVFEAYELDFANMHVLEFGCNFGASAIVLAALGARVSAIDIDANILALARANAAIYGLEARIDFLCVNDTRSMPFADSSFDAVNCNSVLEYIPISQLASVQGEINRVLKPGGLIFVTGTSNRLSPVEMHSRRLLVNYLPRCLDRLIFRTQATERGIFPWTVRYGFGHYDNVDLITGGQAFVESKRRMGHPAARIRALRLINALTGCLGLWVGLLLPSLTLTLRKRAVPGRS